MSETLQLLVLVRHGESEGDVRRAAYRRGELPPTTKLPEHEELTPLGWEQSSLMGSWIQKNIIERLGLTSFDGYFVSPSPRSEQTAAAMELPLALWQIDDDLDERNRGQVRGLSPQQHKTRFADSYQQMKTDPLHWTPPGGEAIIPHLIGRIGRFCNHIEGLRTVLAVGHRDWLWGHMLLAEHLTESELAAIDTDAIHNGQILAYTSLNPQTGQQTPEQWWMCSVNPTDVNTAANWHLLPNAAKINT